MTLYTSSSQVAIRRLEPLDAAIYREFRLRGLREHADAFTSSFEEESERALAKTEERLSPAGDTVMWSAFVDGAMAGVVGLNRETRVKNCHKATLVAMYVAPEHQGRGIGRALISKVLEEACAGGVELVVLTVTAGNREATSLYEKCGFKSFGTEPDAIRVNGISFGKTHMYLQLKTP